MGVDNTSPATAAAAAAAAAASIDKGMMVKAQEEGEEECTLMSMTLEGRPKNGSSSMEQEEDGTATTSSLSSLSPDNPMYHNSRPSSEQDQDELRSPLDSFDELRKTNTPATAASPSSTASAPATAPSRKIKEPPAPFLPQYHSTRLFLRLSKIFLRKYYSVHDNSTWIGFWALLCVTCANYVLTPMRDAVALAVGVSNLPKLTLASTLLAVLSSVPIGWLFEAPDPKRRTLWKRVGLTRGETQGTSLALFYRFFMGSVLSYAFGFFVFRKRGAEEEVDVVLESISKLTGMWWALHQIGQFMYIAFFLVMHLMKLHSLSLIWGVTTEAMDYEDVARSQHNVAPTKTRLQRLAFIGFGGTLGGILGSVVASSMAHILKLWGLLVVAALLLEFSAELATELGRVMQKHWEEQQSSMKIVSTENLAALDTSMVRSVSMNSMKRVASGNSLHKVQSLSQLANDANENNKNSTNPQRTRSMSIDEPVDDNTFTQRLLRGITTILRSRLLMSIFTYNALYASTTVLLSFQRAALVVARNAESSKESDTAFLANINMASSLAVFALQASGIGAFIATRIGSQGTLSLMPIIRLLGVLGLAWWHRYSNGEPPNLVLFLLLDECTRVMNFAVAKPVRESLWRGLSNEARYEAKPIVDTLANRWGGGSAAFLVSCTDKTLDLFGVGTMQNDGSRNVLGYPPVLFLCMIIAAWWAMVSIDLGRIRRLIDLELKKHQ